MGIIFYDTGYNLSEETPVRYVEYFASQPIINDHSKQTVAQQNLLKVTVFNVKFDLCRYVPHNKQIMFILGVVFCSFGREAQERVCCFTPRE
jgi:hypothetical protein